MPGIIHFETFIISAILLNLAPGNDTIFILSQSISRGQKAGIVSVFGISTGLLVHTTLAAFGLSLIIAQSMLIFNIIKYTGAVYLVFIGIKMLLSKSPLTINSGDVSQKMNLKKIYRDGILTNVFNPKVALFFMAFLPQFIDINYKESILPFLTLGIAFTITGTTWCLILSGFSSLISSKLRGNEKFVLYLNKVCGCVLIALGIKVAITNRRS